MPFFGGLHQPGGKFPDEARSTRSTGHNSSSYLNNSLDFIQLRLKLSLSPSLERSVILKTECLFIE